MIVHPNYTMNCRRCAAELRVDVALCHPFPRFKPRVRPTPKRNRPVGSGQRLSTTHSLVKTRTKDASPSLETDGERERESLKAGPRKFIARKRGRDGSLTADASTYCSSSRPIYG